MSTVPTLEELQAESERLGLKVEWEHHPATVWRGHYRSSQTLLMPCIHVYTQAYRGFPHQL